MQHYVGLDVSLKQTAVCVVDQAGKIRREGMVASDPKAIAEFIVANAPQVIRIGFESGATSCGGHSPNAERTVGPARIVTESLTRDPELERWAGACISSASRRASDA